MMHDNTEGGITYVEPMMSDAEWQAFFEAERRRRNGEDSRGTVAEELPNSTSAAEEAPQLAVLPFQSNDRRTHTTAQLLATATGVAETTAEHLLNTCEHTLKLMSGKTAEWYVKQGLSAEEAERLCTTFELARRWASSHTTHLPVLNNSRKIAAYMARYLVDLAHEEVWLLALTPALRPKATICLSQGGISASIIDIRLTLLEVLRARATHFVLLHNHPEGAPIPSREDDAITTQLYRAAQQVELKLLDHIIIGEGQQPLASDATEDYPTNDYCIITPTEDMPEYAYYSYADRGTLPI